MSPEETIADRIFKKCVQYGRDGLWFDRLKAAAIIKHTMAAEKALRHDAMTAYAKLEADWRAEKSLREAAEARAAGLETGIKEAWHLLDEIILDDLDAEVHRISVPSAVGRLYALGGALVRLLAPAPEQEGAGDGK